MLACKPWGRPRSVTLSSTLFRRRQVLITPDIPQYTSSSRMRWTETRRLEYGVCPNATQSPFLNDYMCIVPGQHSSIVHSSPHAYSSQEYAHYQRRSAEYFTRTGLYHRNSLLNRLTSVYLDSPIQTGIPITNFTSVEVITSGTSRPRNRTPGETWAVRHDSHPSSMNAVDNQVVRYICIVRRRVLRRVLGSLIIGATRTTLVLANDPGPNVQGPSEILRHGGLCMSNRLSFVIRICSLVATHYHFMDCMDL